MERTYPQTTGDVVRTRSGVATQLFTPWNKQDAAERYSVISSLVSPSTKFRLPLTFNERLLLCFSWIVKKIDVLEHSFIFRPNSIPPHWHIILSFLHKEGIVNTPSFSSLAFLNDKPKFPIIRIDGKDNSLHKDSRNTTIYGFAAGETYEETFSKAVGELLERSFLAQYKQSELFISTAVSLSKKGAKFLDPKSLPRFKDWQKDINIGTYTDEDELSWVKAEDLSSNESLYVPAQIIFWNYDTVYNKEPILGYHTTNGAGGYFSREGAYLSAIYENVQRDGFLIYWLNSLSPLIVDIESGLDKYPILKKRLEYFKRYNIHPIFLNTTSDIKIPSLSCVIIDRNGRTPLATVGASTGFDFETIALSSLYESISVNKSRFNSEPFVLPKNYKPFKDSSVKRKERLSLWQGEEFLKKFNFFVSGEKQSVDEFMGKRQLFANEAENLKRVIEILEKAGHKIYGYEVNDRILKKLGYHVVKTIIPGLIPLYLKENLALLGAERLRTVPEKLGYTPAKELNPWPHPFP